MILRCVTFTLHRHHTERAIKQSKRDRCDVLHFTCFDIQSVGFGFMNTKRAGWIVADFIVMFACISKIQVFVVLFNETS